MLHLGAEYAPVPAVLFPAAVATGFQALYQAFNGWLLANGIGERLQRLLIGVGTLNLVSNLVLIPFWGALGAAVASGVGSCAYLLWSISAYRREVEILR